MFEALGCCEGRRRALGAYELLSTRNLIDNHHAFSIGITATHRFTLLSLRATLLRSLRCCLGGYQRRCAGFILVYYQSVLSLYASSMSYSMSFVFTALTELHSQTSHSLPLSFWESAIRLLSFVLAIHRTSVLISPTTDACQWC